MQADAEAGHGLPAWVAAAPAAFGLVTGSLTVSVADAVFGWNRTSPAYVTVTVWSPAVTAAAVAVAVMMPFSFTASAAIWLPSTLMVALPPGLCGVPTTSAVTVTFDPGAGLSEKEIMMSALVCVVVTVTRAVPAATAALPS